MMKNWSIALSMLSLLQPASLWATELKQAVIDCATIQASAERLQCFDQLARNQQLDTYTNKKKLVLSDTDAPAPTAKSAGTSADVAPVAKVAGWELVQDEQHVTLSMPSADSPSAMSQARLWLKCEAGKPAQISIDWGLDVGSYVYVTAGTNKDTSQRLNWRSSGDGHSTTYPKDASILLRQWLVGERFTAYARVGQETTLQAVFPLSGFAKAIQPHQATCGL